MDCFEDQLKRARTMAYGGPDSDLSISDQIALQAVIERLEEFERDAASAWAASPANLRDLGLGRVEALAAT